MRTAVVVLCLVAPVAVSQNAKSKTPSITWIFKGDAPDALHAMHRAAIEKSSMLSRLISTVEADVQRIEAARVAIGGKLPDFYPSTKEKEQALKAAKDRLAKAKAELEQLKAGPQIPILTDPFVIGEIGRLHKPDVKAVKVVNEDSLLATVAVEKVSGKVKETTVILSMPTAGIKDGADIKVTKPVEVVTTHKVDATEFYVLIPIDVAKYLVKAK